METSAEFKSLVDDLREIRSLYIEALAQLDILTGLVSQGRVDLNNAKEEIRRLEARYVQGSTSKGNAV